MTTTPDSPIVSTTVSPDHAEPRFEKKKRATVRVACNTCRAKKVRCNAERPVCSWCATHNIECVYATRDEDETRVAALKRENESLKEHVEVLHRLLHGLKALPFEESVDLLKQLRHFASPSALNPSMPNGGYVESPEVRTVSRILPAYTGMDGHYAGSHPAPLSLPAVGGKQVAAGFGEVPSTIPNGVSRIWRTSSPYDPSGGRVE